MSPDTWVIPPFTAKVAGEGGVIRRKIRDVERYVGRDIFEDKLKRRGYHAVENAGQLIISCNQEPIRFI